MSKSLFRVRLGLVGLMAMVAAYYLYPNSHPVIPLQVYRSAQLNAVQINEFAQDKHIKSMINLRGASNDEAWYRQEIAASRDHQIAHYDLGLPAHGLASPNDMRQLAQLILHAQKPLLIHCWRGADRTGLAAAMSLILLQDAPLATAKGQINWRYGAVASDTIGKEEFYYYELWLQKNHLTSSRENFMVWLAQLQPGPDYPYHD